MDQVMMNASQNKFFDFEQREAARKAQALEAQRRADYDSEDESDLSEEEEKKFNPNQSHQMAHS